MLARIEAVDPVLNAFCLVAGDEAMAQAAASEARWQRGEPMGALDGVPTSIKDLVLTKGWPTRRGSRTVDPDQPWDVDAPATARLREAGAVLIGKTTTPEFGCKAETNSPLTGLTRNPWDPTRSPGGSSGGTAAAVAAGLGPVGIGTDGAGSIRIPAAFCGNVGLKASFGRIPAYPPSPFGTVSHLGPHTMDVADAALMLDVLKGPDARDWTSLPPDPTDVTAGLDDGVAGLRVAYSPALGYATVDPEVAAAVDVGGGPAGGGRRARRGRRSRASTTRWRSPRGLWFTGAWTLWSALTPEQQAVTDPDFAGRGRARRDAQQPRRAAAPAAAGRAGVAAAAVHDPLRPAGDAAVAVPAFEVRPAGHTPMSPAAMLGFTPFSYPFNLSQQPAITVPCGLTAAGLPIGVQLVGPMFADALVLRAARAYERSRGPTPRPPVEKTVLNQSQGRS